MSQPPANPYPAHDPPPLAPARRLAAAAAAAAQQGYPQAPRSPVPAVPASRSRRRTATRPAAGPGEEVERRQDPR